MYPQHFTSYPQYPPQYQSSSISRPQQRYYTTPRFNDLSQTQTPHWHQNQIRRTQTPYYETIEFPERHGQAPAANIFYGPTPWSNLYGQTPVSGGFAVEGWERASFQAPAVNGFQGSNQYVGEGAYAHGQVPASIVFEDSQNFTINQGQATVEYGFHGSQELVVAPRQRPTDKVFDRSTHFYDGYSQPRGNAALKGPNQSTGVAGQPPARNIFDEWLDQNDALTSSAPHPGQQQGNVGAPQSWNFVSQPHQLSLFDELLDQLDGSHDGAGKQQAYVNGQGGWNFFSQPQARNAFDEPFDQQNQSLLQEHPKAGEQDDAKKGLACSPKQESGFWECIHKCSKASS
jgi:hypothetical protein